ncbi:MAG: DUF5615 family PIN-like protein [Chloroflexi bacterium]|nr:DUF5615 family PIN-like protein [Chloroflexota bacterium]
MRDAKDAQIARHAQEQRLCLLTADQDFADVRNYPPSHYSGIVVLSLPRNATSRYINNLLHGFLAHETVLTQLPGKLAIVEPGRVRLRDRKVQLRNKLTSWLYLCTALYGILSEHTLPWTISPSTSLKSVETARSPGPY